MCNHQLLKEDVPHIHNHITRACARWKGGVDTFYHDTACAMDGGERTAATLCTGRCVFVACRVRCISSLSSWSHHPRGDPTTADSFVELGKGFIRNSLLSLLADEAAAQAELARHQLLGDTATLTRLRSRMQHIRRRIIAARDNFHLSFIRYLVENFTKLIIPKSGVEGQVMRKRWREDLGAFVERQIGRSVASGIQLFSWGIFLRKLEHAVACVGCSRAVWLAGLD